MNTNNTLKEYYINIQKLYSNAVNMLSALNQSLTTTSSEVTVSMVSNDDVYSTLRLPSFLYLENKVEQLANNMDNLFNMPESGEAWFNNSNGMYKLEMIKSNTAPLTPLFSDNSLSAITKDNNILRDLVSPKTCLKVNIDNLPNNIEQMFMRKYIIHSAEIFNSTLLQNASSYEEFKAALFGLKNGVDYEVYDSTIDLPLKNDVYNSSFSIIELPTVDLNNNIIENPYIDSTSSNSVHYTYVITLDKITYTNAEDNTIIFTIKEGDFLCLGNKYVIYKVKTVFPGSNRIIIEEYLGHIALQTVMDNSEMVLQIYNEDYSKYHYVDVPLEENRYICIFLGTIFNNTRSMLSKPLLIDLNTVLIYDKNGNPIYDEFGAHMHYLTYYEKYCKNIGDLILGITEATYPQLTNFNANDLSELSNNDTIKLHVTNSIKSDSRISVVPINKHLIDDTSIEEIINLHTRKSEMSAELGTVNNNISNVYNQMLTTDFSQDIAVTHESLKTKINDYYNQKTVLQQQINALVNEISVKSADVTLGLSDTKYRVRGFTDTEALENYLHNNFGEKCDVIGLDVEYKYKSLTADTTTVSIIDNSTFTDWNKQSNIDKQRQLSFNSEVSAFNIEYVEYLNTDNVIKWNQIDIPIKQGEDVVLRVRYKYSIGQPFINLYTPWSDDFTVVFPSQYEENVELNTIIENNNSDSISAAFTAKLMTDGYEEHINNKIIDGSQTFFHMPENIYSGFNTPENSLISLKDKLGTMSSDINKYRELIEGELAAKYSVYLQYNDNTIEINRNTNNNVNIFNVNHIRDTFVTENMNIVIKNTGTSTVKLYSILPGNTDTALLTCDNDYYNSRLKLYERVPLIENNEWSMQTLGQWIYFRQSNIWTNTNFYLNTKTQREQNFTDIYNLYQAQLSSNVTTSLYELKPVNSFVDYIGKDNKQLLYAYRQRATEIFNQNTKSETITNNLVWSRIFIAGTTDKEIQSSQIKYTDSIFTTATNNTIEDSHLTEMYANLPKEMYMYYTAYDDNNAVKYKYHNNNNLLLRYEDIVGVENDKFYFLDNKTSISKFINKYSFNNVNSLNKNDLIGAFLFPSIDNHNQLITDGNENGYISIDSGKSVSIPITFEYYLDYEAQDTINSITKTISFDIRPSLYKSEENYTISITANVDNTTTGKMYVTDDPLYDMVTD